MGIYNIVSEYPAFNIYQMGSILQYPFYTAILHARFMGFALTPG
jgi:hypothetical protein